MTVCGMPMMRFLSFSGMFSGSSLQHHGTPDKNQSPLDCTWTWDHTRLARERGMTLRPVLVTRSALGVERAVGVRREPINAPPEPFQAAPARRVAPTAVTASLQSSPPLIDGVFTGCGATMHSDLRRNRADRNMYLQRLRKAWGETGDTLRLTTSHSSSQTHSPSQRAIDPSERHKYGNRLCSVIFLPSPQ